MDWGSRRPILEEGVERSITFANPGVPMQTSHQPSTKRGGSPLARVIPILISLVIASSVGAATAATAAGASGLGTAASKADPALIRQAAAAPRSGLHVI